MNPEQIILTALQRVHPRMLKENVLWSDVRNDGHDMSLTDLRRHVRALEIKEGGSQVVVIKGEDATRIKITTEGLARLAE